MKNSKLWVVSKKMGICLRRTWVENKLNSFALDFLGKSNACPFAAIIALKDIHPSCCPKEGPAATWFVPAPLLCQLLQDRRTNLISHFYQKFLPSLTAIWTFCPRLHGKQNFGSMLDSISIQCRTLITRQGWGWQISRP